MNQAVISDEALRQAAASVGRAMLDSLPPPSRCEHTFSDLFQARMKRLLSRHDRRQTLRTLFRRVAAVLLAALLGGGVWLSVDAGARAAFLTWAREVYEEQILYRFSGAPAADTLPLYQITWLPEGYEPVDIFYDDQIAYNAWYQKGEDAMSSVVFDYGFIQEGSLVELLLFDEEDYLYKTIEVNGVPADLYLSQAPGETSHMIWFDEDAGIAFSLSFCLEESVILHIAESIVLTDSTK